MRAFFVLIPVTAPGYGLFCFEVITMKGSDHHANENPQGASRFQACLPSPEYGGISQLAEYLHRQGKAGRAGLLSQRSQDQGIITMLKVAGNANPRHKGETKRERRLRARTEDFMKGSQGQNKDRQGTRWDAGGYHKPGSLQ